MARCLALASVFLFSFTANASGPIRRTSVVEQRGKTAISSTRLESSSGGGRQIRESFKSERSIFGKLLGVRSTAEINYKGATGGKLKGEVKSSRRALVLFGKEIPLGRADVGDHLKEMSTK